MSHKIGKTTKPLLKRFNQYPNGSRLILQMECLDCDYCEKKLLELFRSKYTNKLEYGREYFQGDSISMTRDIFEFIMSERQLNDTKVNVEIVKVDEPVKVAKPKKIPVKVIKDKPIEVPKHKNIIEIIKDKPINVCSQTCNNFVSKRPYG